MDRVDVVADADVPTLCSVIAVTLEDGAGLVQDQRMATDDYAYDRARVSDLARRIGAEEGVPALAYDRLERFVASLPEGAVADLVTVDNHGSIETKGDGAIGVFAQSIGFPTVARDKARLRTIVSATHTRDDLQYALDTFAAVGRELGVI